jgi:hypothetical protein
VLLHVCAREKLTPIAVVYQLICSESFTNQGSRGDVIAVGATMNFFEQFNACLLSDALHQDFFLRILAHEDAIDQYILFATAYKVLILCSVSITSSIL